MLVYLVARFWQVGISLNAAAGIASILSFVFLYCAEKDLWLSRFMGLRLGPHSSRIKETFFLWLLGIPGLFLRSSVGPKLSPERTPVTLEQPQGISERPTAPAGEADARPWAAAAVLPAQAGAAVPVSCCARDATP